jgi:hypothetical protein
MDVRGVKNGDPSVHQSAVSYTQAFDFPDYQKLKSPMSASRSRTAVPEAFLHGRSSDGRTITTLEHDVGSRAFLLPTARQSSSVIALAPGLGNAETPHRRP